VGRRYYQKLVWPDFLKDTMQLNGIEKGIYLMLMGGYFMSGKPLPDDDARLANIAHLTLEQWRSIRPALEGYFDIFDGLWHQERIERDIREIDAEIEGKSKGGKSAQSKLAAKREAQQTQLESQLKSQSELKVQSESKAVINRLRTALETELMDRTQAVVGAEDMRTHGGLWRTLMRKDVTTYKKVLLEIESMTKEQHLPERQFKKSPGACFIDLYKRWTDAN
jgi:uncharacterized protein YdaU (DUF1376 family)